MPQEESDVAREESDMPREKSFLKRIPKVDTLLQEPAMIRLREILSHETVVGIVRDVLAETRRLFLEGTACSPKAPPVP